MLIARDNVLPAEEKKSILDAFKARWRMWVEDHHIICWILDSRLCGAGMSPAGARKARFLAVKLFTRLFPSGDVDEFLKQWFQYMNKGMAVVCRILFDA